MHLTLHLTRACQLRCDYCYAPPRPEPGMRLETAIAALEFGLRENSEAFGLAFFGGEPLLHKDLIRAVVAHGEALEAPGRPPVRFKLTTNGIALDDEFLTFAAAKGVHIALSLDGVRAAHEAHRRFPDGSSSFDRTLDALRRLLKVRPYSLVHAVVNPDTAPLMAESAAFLLDEGVRYLSFSLNFAAPWTDEDLDVLEGQYALLAERYVDWTRAGRKFYLAPFEKKLASHIRQGECHHDRCELGVRQLSVSPEGDLFPCVQFANDGRESPSCMGDVWQGVDEIARLRWALRSSPVKAFCEGCALTERCEHTCGCLNRQATGDINGVSPVMCRHEQMSIAAADRVGAILYAERNAYFLRKHYNPAYPLLSLVEDLAGEGLAGWE
ncbi:MAG: radical SAM protein [Pseudomonadota bacterium]